MGYAGLTPYELCLISAPNARDFVEPATSCTTLQSLIWELFPQNTLVSHSPCFLTERLERCGAMDSRHKATSASDLRPPWSRIPSHSLIVSMCCLPIQAFGAEILRGSREAF